ncbi:conjugation system SOS inhibitor PsiB family protein [Photorhabdus bodei]|uniref:Conjugation system SOS inhibitor PsiB family protein n=1 Tax=Photorhabdus bodei TaxID=2029681 RepID=A0AAW6BPE6_9GAMM|nr:conjugation system SOS inhibitor PsiB family protein [Photorhabdus bodei]MDB6375008.1 conjugation system SOS inhibitor PsiB family protein [Photorhabdus bodei]
MALIDILSSAVQLNAMTTDALEQFSKRGQDYRHALLCSILKCFKVSEGWTVQEEVS